MIKKSILQSIISKYYLDINEKVKWVIENKKLDIGFTSPSKDLIGKISYSEFELDDNVELSIFDTKKLTNFINVCEEDIKLSVYLDQKSLYPTKLLITDNKFECSYTLADPLLIAKNGIVNEPQWDVEFDLSSDDINNLIKAKKALQDNSNVSLIYDTDFENNSYISFVFGDISDYNNKITYNIPCSKSNSIINIQFDSEYIRSILKANDDSKSAKMFINNRGLLKMKFNSTDNIESEYFLVKKSSQDI